MDIKRLFLATFADTSVLEQVYPEIISSFENISKGKWVELQNIHFTYKFLGDVDLDLVEKVKGSLAGLLREYHNELIFKGVGVFPNKSKPRVMFINILDDSNTLRLIHEQTEKILMALGFEPEKRNFHPHLTLRRLKSVKYPDFKRELDSNRETEFGSMKSFRAVLVESFLTRNGPIYKILE